MRRRHPLARRGTSDTDLVVDLLFAFFLIVIAALPVLCVIGYQRIRRGKAQTPARTASLQE